MIHGYWLKTYGIDGSYEAIDVRRRFSGLSWSLRERVSPAAT
jgi:hypothetical protein